MLSHPTFLCGVADGDPYTGLFEVAAYTALEAAGEYCIMFEGGWDGDHFNLTHEEPRTIQVLSQGVPRNHKNSYYSVVLAEDSDQEYVITEVSGHGA